MIEWTYFPRSDPSTPIVQSVVAAFELVSSEIDSSSHDLDSNAVLGLIRPHLEAVGFSVESGKRASQKLRVPVLFGRNGAVAKSFDADAWHHAAGFVLEVEAGRGVVNNQFLKDFFQACMMIDVSYLGIAVRKGYRGKRDFEIVETFFDTLFASRRLETPLKGILILGY